VANDGLYNDEYLAGSSQSGTKASAVQKVRQRLSQLESERSSWEPTWRDISAFISPRHGRFFTTDANKGERKDLSIVNNKATRASRIKAAGIMGGLTNPATPWIRYSTPDPGLNEYEPVQSWLSTLADRLLWAFQRSNVYGTLHSIYGDLDYGTGCMHVEEDSERVLRSYLYPIGSFYLANSWRQRVDTVYRKFQMTASQIVEKFCLDAETGKIDFSKVSDRCRDAYENNRLDHWFEVLHVKEPNRELVRGQLDRRGMPIRSCYLELGSDEAKGFLSERGFREDPDMAPRWDVNGEDIYGTGTGHDAIGDAKALQTLERRKAQFIDKLAQPSMQLPSAMRGEPVSLLPNSLMFVDSLGPAQAVRPVYEPNPAGLTAIEASIREHEKRIDEAYGVDIWVMFANDTQGQMTATEVLRRREEKMLLMGPYLMRLDHELLDPLVDRGSSILMRQGLMPPPPKELQGQEIRVEYQSVLAQAQRAMGITSLHSLVAFTGTLAQMQLAAGQQPDVLDKLDMDQAVDDFHQRAGTRPEIVRSDEKVAQRRAARAEQQQAQAAVQQAQQVADVAKTASETDLEGDNAASRLLQSITGGRA
jgi:hypothetical protein